MSAFYSSPGPTLQRLNGVSRAPGLWGTQLRWQREQVGSLAEAQLRANKRRTKRTCPVSFYYLFLFLKRYFVISTMMYPKYK